MPLADLVWSIGFAAGLVVLLAGLMLGVARAVLPRVARVRTARVACPRAGGDAAVRYLARDGEEPLVVISCTAFANPLVTTCGTPCRARLGDALARRAPGVLAER